MNANTQHDNRLGMRSVCKMPDSHLWLEVWPSRTWTRSYLIWKMYWFAPPFELTATVSHKTGMVWGYCCLCLQPALCYLALSISKQDFLHLNFYSWTCSKEAFGNFFSYTEACSISEFPRNTYSLAQAVFPLGVPSVLNAAIADVWNKFLCILQCKTKKCKPEWQEVILWSINLYYSQTLAVNEIPQVCITDTALAESFYFQNTGEGFPPQIRS